MEKINKRLLNIFALVLVTLVSGCEVVGGIFKAGMVWGIFLVVVIVVAIIYLISKSRK